MINLGKRTINLTTIRRNTFGQILSQNSKTVCLKENLVPRLIRICRIQRSSSLFSFSTGNTLFGQIFQFKKLSV